MFRGYHGAGGKLLRLHTPPPFRKKMLVFILLQLVMKRIATHAVGYLLPHSSVVNNTSAENVRVCLSSAEKGRGGEGRGNKGRAKGMAVPMFRLTPNVVTHSEC